MPVYEVGEEDGQPFLVMQLANGGSLQQHLADGPLPPRLAADIIRQLAEAVQHAHDHGVVHRDLKPGNILLHHEGPASAVEPSSGSTLRGARLSGSLPPGLRVQLTDFGLARLVTEEGLTATGEVMGTPSYMPPEQAVGNKKAVGPLVDVYSLGAVLYALLTGRPPFQAATPLEILRLVQDQEPVPPRRLSPGVPLDLEAVCLRCLEKDPTRRYASAAALAADLGRFLRGEPTQARPVGALGRGRRWVRRNPGVAGMLATVVGVLLLGSVVSTFFGVEARATKPGKQEMLSKQPWSRKKRRGKPLKHTRVKPGMQEQKANDALVQVKLEKSRFADAQLSRAEMALYTGQLASAQREWQDGNGTRAREILSSCQWNLRNVEFGHLWSLYNDNKQTMCGHTGVVTCVAHSPDGKRLVSGSSDKTLKVWDADTGQEIRTLVGHTGAITCVAFSPDGKRLVSGSEDRTVKVWDVQTGQEIRTLEGHTSGVTCVAFSPDGKASSAAARTRHSRCGMRKRDRRSAPSRGTPPVSPAWRSARTANASSAAARTRR